MKKTLLKVGALLALLGLLAVVERANAQTPTATDEVVACLDNAGNAFVKCVDEHAWYVAVLCELRFNADALLCAPTMAFKGYAK